jgi:molybdenum cofactor biosynthesis enzyme MoaA
MEKEVSYELGVTYKCNWNCSYCISNTHLQPYKTLENVLQEIDLFENNSSVTLSGGEPGMLSENDLDIIIKKLQDKNIIIDLVTNGLFLEKYSHFLDRISNVLYHCVEDLETKKDIKFYKIENKIKYILVYEKITDLEYYLNKYSNIHFIITPNIKKGKTYNIKEFLKILNKYPNIHKDSKKEFLRNISKK